MSTICNAITLTTIVFLHGSSLFSCHLAFIKCNSIPYTELYLSNYIFTNCSKVECLCLKFQCLLIELLLQQQQFTKIKFHRFN